MKAYLPKGLEEVLKARKRSSKIAKLPKAVPGNFSAPPPPHIADRQRAHIANSDAVIDRQHELPSFLNALKLIPANCDYDAWFRLGAAIHDFDPGPDGLLIFKSWSWQSEGHREDSAAACERKWLEYSKKQGEQGLITKSTIYAAAVEIEKKVAKPRIAVRGAAVNVSNSGAVSSILDANGQIVTLPPQFTQASAIRFPDLDRRGNPTATCANARVAIQRFGLCCEYDTFHQHYKVAGNTIGKWAGDITDDMVHVLRIVTLENFGFDPGSQHAYDAAVQECIQHAYHPILTYLDGLEWDRKPRIGQWLTTYMQAEDTIFNRETQKLMLLAAVRRVRQPGCKFDQIMVLEGPEGRGKSLALETLAGRENFSDHAILTLDDRAQQEEVRGVWLYEISELTGIRKADIDRVKAFASRTIDRARPAYARRRVDQPRTCVFFGTTNENRYLQSMTGNRRFWPIKTARIDVDGIARDRDQLWAEADYHIKQGASIGLAEKFWPAAAEIQESRREHDMWEERISEITPREIFYTDKGQEWRMTSTEILTSPTILGVPTGQVTVWHYKRLVHIMHKLGWEGPLNLKLSENKVGKGFKKVI